MATKSRRKRTLLILLAILVLLCGAGGFWLAHLRRASALATTLEWGRLVPFPSSATEVAISVEGGFFSRGFRSSFSAPAADIEQWLKASPGTHEAELDLSAPGVRHFLISPGGGAQWAEVRVDDARNQVAIYVYWS